MHPDAVSLLRAGIAGAEGNGHHAAMRSFATWLPLAASVFAACSSGGSGTGNAGIDPGAIDVLACRARVDDPFRFAEIATRDGRNLGLQRVGDRTGTERDVRLHPDGNRVVFARERTAGDPGSRELFLSSLDGTVAELRLTQNSDRDDEPCWAPDGTHILFTNEHDGSSRILRIGLDGGAAEAWITPLVGGSDGEASCHVASNRLVWSRADGNGRHVLWLAAADGTGAFQLTDGGVAAGSGNGDRQPAFSADGTRVVFVRRINNQLALLCLCDIATNTVTTRLQALGELGWPRFAPAGDRLWFGIAEPLQGRTALRLAHAPLTSGAAVLAWPDARWQLTGLDLRGTLAAVPAAAAPTTLDVTRATLEIAAGSNVSGTKAMLVSADASEYLVETTTFDGREIAGINVKFDLPVTAATDVLELRVRSVARSTRIDASSRLRMSIYNPVDQRFDTCVELAPSTTGVQTMEFTTSSLRHVTQQKQLRVTVIADLEPGARAQLWIDQVEVALVARSTP